MTGEPRWQELFDLGFYAVMSTTSVHEADRGLGGVDAAAHELVGKRRREEHTPVETGVDFVLHDLRAEHRPAHHPGVDAEGGFDSGAPDTA